MAGSMKDALESAGITQTAPESPKKQQASKEWANALPEDHPPHVPFDAPALTKPKGSAPAKGALPKKADPSEE
jgi:hypothetical protein